MAFAFDFAFAFALDFCFLDFDGRISHLSDTAADDDGDGDDVDLDGIDGHADDDDGFAFDRRSRSGESDGSAWLFCNFRLIGYAGPF